MQDKEFDLLVFIGRMRPFHKGHQHVIDTALERAHNVLILLGSSNRPCEAMPNLCFNSDEVSDMIRSVYPFGSDAGGRLSISEIDDWLHDNDFTWLSSVHQLVQAEVHRIQGWSGSQDPLRIGLVGYSKDGTSYYLKKFPQWGSIDVGPYKQNGKILNATSIRNALYDATTAGLVSDLTAAAFTNVLPKPVAEWVAEWCAAPANQERLKYLAEAVEFSTDYKKRHKFVGPNARYDATHSTTDAVLIQSGHVLMIKRKFNPGKGLWALPGGFVEATEQIREGVTRELRQETKIKLGLGVLNLAFRFKVVFSDPNRGDARGRIITHAYLYQLNDRSELPAVEAADDADHAEWVPLGLLDPSQTYADHYWIIQKMINMIPVD